MNTAIRTVIKKEGPAKPVERLFPFVMRSRNLLVGRETLLVSKRGLHFVMITDDLSEKGRAEVLSEFAHYLVVQRYTAAELEEFFGLRGTLSREFLCAAPERR